ncbi:hypothetical protein K505DRAFT_257965 [Melanomma pulvis-pyrius CBS 109.77]|uniref:HTH psq-type domain-containing protein n=1 Tax=Melanomma pulvis-pyrius CBS 109.77 TaxID=1314802 RepID=A0A6A6WT44_9PLEO|nr:hypothetical protein K505DRAFT_257965 [Melanomma pulvis-pyrius CBS 109.77]
MDPQEQAIEQAISDYCAGVYPSKRRAAKAFSLSKKTLRRRLNSYTNSTTSY